MLDICNKTWYNTHMSSPFRNEQNQRYTRVLFREQQSMLPVEDRLIEPLYTLQHPYKDLPCFRHIYVSLGDPTGYQLAIRYLEDFDHWQLLMKSPWFRAAKEVWDAELDAKLSSEGIASIRMFADGIEGVAPAIQLQAAKYLADKQFRKQPKVAGVGRPTKEAVAGELKRTAAEEATIASDMSRILKAVK